MDIWVRKCDSFAEEAQADREFWACMTPDERVAVVEELRTRWCRERGLGEPRLEKVARVIERAR